MAHKNNDKHATILSAALELFAENGFHGAPTSAIAEKAGVGVGTIYRYFKDKDQLIRELHRNLHQCVRDQIVKGYSEEQPIKERFSFLCSRVLQFFLSSPKEFKFMELYYYSSYAMAGESTFPEEDEPIRNLLAEARQLQIIKDAPLEVLEAIAFGPIVALAKSCSHRGLQIDDEMIGLTVQAAWDALKPADASSPSTIPIAWREAHSSVQDTYHENQSDEV